MSRTEEALKLLIEKCTDGATPDGDRVCDLLECLVKHYSHYTIVNVSGTSGNYTADLTFEQLKSYVDEGKLLKCKYDGSYYDLVSATNNAIRFSKVMHSTNGSSITGVSIVAVEIGHQNEILVAVKTLV